MGIKPLSRALKDLRFILVASWQVILTPCHGGRQKTQTAGSETEDLVPHSCTVDMGPGSVSSGCHTGTERGPGST